MKPQLHQYPGYEENLSRYCQLLRLRDAVGLTAEQHTEFQRVNETLSRIEYASFRSLRALTDDYDQVAAMGDLGGVELL